MNARKLSLSDRDNVTHKEILLPSQLAGNPDYDWARDRATLWNRTENTDRHRHDVPSATELIPTMHYDMILAGEMADDEVEVSLRA